MGIAVDYRAGSKELAPLILAYGIQATVKKLEFGDLEFEGNGPEGRCGVVIERKTIDDLVACIQTKRLSGHQLPGMADTYDYCYLLVEGIWKPGEQNETVIGHGSMEGKTTYGGSWRPSHGRPMLYRAVDNYLATLELQAGVIYRRTLSINETVATVVNLYHWWNGKLWSEHSSHLGVYAPAIPKKGKTRLNLTNRPVSLAEKWAMQLDGVDSKAQVVAEHFGSALKLAVGLEEEWEEIKGIGKNTAKRIVRDINASV